MPDVKILAVYDSDTDYGSSAVIVDSISDWEHITDEELRQLMKWHHHLKMPHNRHSVVIVKDDVPIQVRLNSVRGFIQQQEAEQEKRRATRAAAVKRRENVKKEKDRKKYEELKAKFERKETR
jgi:proline racemase